MPQLKSGAWLFLALALASCRTSQPPKLSLICIGDGYGGADCVDAMGAKIYKSPSELKNFWMTTEADEQNFASWCYDTQSASVGTVMQELKAQAQK